MSQLQAFDAGQRAEFDALCDRMKSDDVSKALREEFHQCRTIRPWAVFVYASRKNNITLGRHAITLFGDDHACPAVRLNQLTEGEIEGIAPGWLVELLRRRLGEQRPCDDQCGGWSAASKASREGYVLEDWGIA